MSAAIVHQRLPESIRDWGAVIAIVLMAAFFEPLKRRIQSWVDRVFDRERYDYRKALVEFGRGLSSETDLRALLESIVERLPRTLLVSRVAVFWPTSRERCSSGWPPHGLPADCVPRSAREQRPGSWVSELRPGDGSLAHLP